MRPDLSKAVGNEGRGNEQRGTSNEESSRSSGGLGKGLSRQMAPKAEAERDPNAEEEQEVKLAVMVWRKQQRSTNMMTKTENYGEGVGA